MGGVLLKPRPFHFASGKTSVIHGTEGFVGLWTGLHACIEQKIAYCHLG